MLNVCLMKHHCNKHSALEDSLKEQNDDYAQRALENLSRIKEDYTLQYKQNFTKNVFLLI